jgi:1,2-dihydroxy-3-keto-5-methylthiopentene dioxygenase
VTRLVVLPDSDPTTTLLDTSDAEAIAAALAPLGVRYERWKASHLLADDASQDDVLAAYASDVHRLCDEGGFVTVDVVRMRRTDEDDATWSEKVKVGREKFLAEHTHADDEVRFFVEGSGGFYLRVDGKVHVVLCEQGDLLGVPADTLHWFDMGTNPRFAAIRFFRIDDGWVGNFTGDPIAASFPTFDALSA